MTARNVLIFDATTLGPKPSSGVTIDDSTNVLQISSLTASRALATDGSKNLVSSATTAVELGYLSGVTSAIQTQLDAKLTGISIGNSKAVITDGSGNVTTGSVTSTELGYLSGVSSAIQTQINGKQATITGGATSITGSNLTASRALASDGSGKVAVSATTSTELGYLSGVTSAVQTQLTAKASDSAVLKKDGSVALTSNWDAGSFEIRAQTFESDATTGTAPLTIASTTVCTNLNADLLDGNHASNFAESSHTHGTSDITSGTLGVSRGGTGLNAYTIGDILYADGTASLNKLGYGTSGQILRTNGIGAAPSWMSTSSITALGTVTTGTWSANTIAINKGGTNATSQTSNGVNYYNGSSITSSAALTFDGTNLSTTGEVLAGTIHSFNLYVSGSLSDSQDTPFLIVPFACEIVRAKAQVLTAPGTSKNIDCAINRAAYNSASFSTNKVAGSTLRISGTGNNVSTTTIASASLVAGDKLRASVTQTSAGAGADLAISIIVKKTGTHA